MLFVGSVATHTCDRENGYVLSGVDSNVMESTRTCSEDGWSGTEITCECKLNLWWDFNIKLLYNMQKLVY